MPGLRPLRWLIVMGLVCVLSAGCAQRTPPASVAVPAAQVTATRDRPPTLRPSPVPSTAQRTPTLAPPRAATFTILYDNVSHRDELQTAWGYACLVQTGEATILFDTGGDGATLLANMALLGVEPAAIDAVVLSHEHADHTAGLAGLLSTGVSPPVYLLASFPEEFRREVASKTRVVEVAGPVEVAPEVYSTGEIGSGIVEQALVVRTDEGIVVITGCAHPGVATMIRAAERVAGGEVALVMGGFHLEDASRAQIEQVIQELGDLGVKRMAPSHCTGDQARQMFAEAFGDACLPAGAGWTVAVGASAHN